MTKFESDVKNVIEFHLLKLISDQLLYLWVSLHQDAKTVFFIKSKGGGVIYPTVQIVTRAEYMMPSLEIKRLISID